MQQGEAVVCYQVSILFLSCEGLLISFLVLVPSHMLSRDLPQINLPAFRIPPSPPICT